MKHTMQRAAAIFLTICLCLGVGACGGEKQQVFPAQAGDFYENIPYEDYINSSAAIPEEVWDIRDYGAAPEADLNTDAINRAISACAQAGGGTVLVQGGVYCTGTVRLQSNVTLQVAGDASIVASHKFSDFSGALIYAENAENIALAGPGKICGEGEYFVEAPKESPLMEPLAVSDIRTMRKEYRKRIRFGIDGRPGAMVWLRNCQNVQVENLVLENSMAWTLNLDRCSQAKISNLVINNNRHVANTDGIDIVGGSNVTVRHCFISTADDGVVVKNGKDDLSASMGNVLISDCQVMTCTNAFKIGTETYGDIHDVTIENCKASLPDIYPGSVSGVSIESADGANVHNVTVRNLELDQVTCPLFIRLCNRNKYKDKDKDLSGSIENVLIENVTATNAELPSILAGVKHKGKTLPLKEVTIRGLYVTYRDSEQNVKLRASVPEYAKVYPENWRFEDVPAYGIWGRHIENLKLEKIQVTPASVDNREAQVLEDVTMKD